MMCPVEFVLVKQRFEGLPGEVLSRWGLVNLPLWNKGTLVGFLGKG